MAVVTKYPDSTKASLEPRLRARARERWPQIASLQIRHRGLFSYVEATLTDATTLKLCRLRYVGSAHHWQFTIYRASHDDYDESVFPAGLPAGTCQDALDTACGLYLNDPTAWHDTRRTYGRDHLAPGYPARLHPARNNRNKWQRVVIYKFGCVTYPLMACLSRRLCRRRGRTPMKLAEALALRAEATRRIEQLRGRIVDNARYQEGEEPAEDAANLLAQTSEACAELEALIRRINRTNASAQMGPETITDAIARRDVLKLPTSTSSA